MAPIPRMTELALDLHAEEEEEMPVDCHARLVVIFSVCSSSLWLGDSMALLRGDCLGQPQGCLPCLQTGTILQTATGWLGVLLPP